MTEPLSDARSARGYDAKIWNLSETPETFHRQAPGFPMVTRCGIPMSNEARETTHPMYGYSPCVVCFNGWAE